MKPKSRIHQKPEELQAHNTEATSSAVQESNTILKSIDNSLKNPVATFTGLQGINDKQRETNLKLDVLTQVNDPALVIQKLDEVKSASLASNILLKRIEAVISIPTTFPDMPRTDLSETNKLLAQLIKKVGENVSVTLTLTD